MAEIDSFLRSFNVSDPNQKLLAIGNREGTVRILGRPGIDLEIQHENGASAAVRRAFILQHQF